MTPAERLRAAADTIERVAADAYPGPWRRTTCGEVLSAAAECSETERKLYGGALVGETMRLGNAAHVALWDRETALLVAPILRFFAIVAETAGDAFTDSAALTFADAILAGAEVAAW